MTDIRTLSPSEMVEIQAKLDAEAAAATKRAKEFREGITERLVPVLPSRHAPGTEHYETDDGCKVSVVQTESVTWDSNLLAELGETYPAFKKYIRVKHDILKSQLNAMPPEMRDLALECATIKPGKLKVEIEKLKPTEQ